MKITLALLQAAMTPNTEGVSLFSEIEACRPAAEVRFAYSRIVETLHEHYRRYRKLYEELVRKYGARDGDKVVVYHPSNTAENMESFGAELQKLLATEVDVDGLPFSLCGLGNPDLTLGELTALGALIGE